MQLQHQNLRGGDETFTSGKARQVWGDPEIGEEGRWREKVSAKEDERRGGRVCRWRGRMASTSLGGLPSEREVGMLFTMVVTITIIILTIVLLITVTSMYDQCSAVEVCWQQKEELHTWELWWHSLQFSTLLPGGPSIILTKIKMQ